MKLDVHGGLEVILMIEVIVGVKYIIKCGFSIMLISYLGGAPAQKVVRGSDLYGRLAVGCVGGWQWFVWQYGSDLYGWCSSDLYGRLTAVVWGRGQGLAVVYGGGGLSHMLMYGKRCSDLFVVQQSFGCGSCAEEGGRR